jgi:hypothetical protein
MNVPSDGLPPGRARTRRPPQAKRKRLRLSLRWTICEVACRQWYGTVHNTIFLAERELLLSPCPLRAPLAEVHRRLLPAREYGLVRVGFCDICETVLRPRHVRDSRCGMALPLAAEEPSERGWVTISEFALTRCRSVRSRGRDRFVGKDALVIRRWHVLLWARWWVATIDAVFTDEREACPPEAAAYEKKGI